MQASSQSTKSQLEVVEMADKTWGRVKPPCRIRLSSIGFRPALIHALEDLTSYARSHSSEIPTKHLENWKALRTDEGRHLGRRGKSFLTTAIFSGLERKNSRPLKRRLR
jgi:hypothetical protein